MTGPRKNRTNARNQEALFPSARLSHRNLLFIDRYLIHGNATRAAIEAGFSEKTASDIGSKTLRKTLVKQELTRRQAELRERFAVTQEKVIEHLARIAFNDPREAFDAQGNLLPIHELQAHVASAIASVETEENVKRIGDVEVKTGTTRKLKFWSKTEALRDLGRFLGLFTDRTEHSADGSWENVLRAMCASEPKL